MTENVNIVAETSAAIGSKASLGGGTASFIAFFAGINWVGWVSLGIAVLGLLINLYFSNQKNRREKELHRLQIEKLQEQRNAKN